MNSCEKVLVVYLSSSYPLLFLSSPSSSSFPFSLSLSFSLLLSLFTFLSLSENAYCMVPSLSLSFTYNSIYSVSPQQSSMSHHFYTESGHPPSGDWY